MRFHSPDTMTNTFYPAFTPIPQSTNMDFNALLASSSNLNMHPHMANLYNIIQKQQFVINSLMKKLEVAQTPTSDPVVKVEPAHVDLEADRQSPQM